MEGQTDFYVLLDARSCTTRVGESALEEVERPWTGRLVLSIYLALSDVI